MVLCPVGPSLLGKIGRGDGVRPRAELTRRVSHDLRANAVPLPDEYDQILKDLEPYRGFSPEMLVSLSPSFRLLRLRPPAI